MGKIKKTTLTTLLIANLIGCSGKQLEPISSSLGTIPVCPSSPNCVSSDALDTKHKIEAFNYISSNEQAWLATREVITTLPRSIIVEETDNYIHMEVKSAFWGFVDDLKLQLRIQDKQIAVYSSSRTGYSDFGINRARTEKIRQALLKRNILK